ncbi:MAG: SDR family oxidoreductase [Pseudomonadales bacterium]
MAKKILVVGATGYVGGKVVKQLLSLGAEVTALVRPSTDAGRLESQGVRVVRGDLTKPGTLSPALTGVDAVVTTAIGYMSTKKGDSLSSVDDIGNKNLVDAALQMHVPKLVFNSVLACDKAESVPHFWQKKLIEDYMASKGLPFVAVRPGAFLDQEASSDFFASGLKKGTLLVMGSTTKKWSHVLTDDLARYLAIAAVEDNIPFGTIDVGMKEPLSMQQLAALASDYTGKSIKIRSIPWPLVGPILLLGGFYKPFLSDLKKMFDFFFTGEYVANTVQQQEVFGDVPTLKDCAYRYFEEIGLEKKG